MTFGSFGPKLLDYCITMLSMVTPPSLIVMDFTAEVDGLVVNVESHPAERVNSLDELKLRSSLYVPWAVFMVAPEGAASIASCIVE